MTIVNPRIPRYLMPPKAPKPVVLRTCWDCPATLTGKKMRCDACLRAVEKARMAAYHIAHRDPAKSKAAWDKWHADNPEKYRQQSLARNIRWELRHPEQRRESIKRYQTKNRATITARDRLRRQKKRGLILPALVMTFPYITVARPEHADYLAINALVPQGIVGREDVVQDIALAIMEGRTSLAELQAEPKAVRLFTRAHRASSFEMGGYAVSLDFPMRSGQSWHDVLAAP